ncbi:MAG: YbjN domain-containing protein [Gemmatimonadetes bacterium]|nr:YbjN domain-containing protein [Gemmatimonadota bacterium]
MHFLTESQRRCYEKIVPWMVETFGPATFVHDAAPALTVMVGSAFAHTAVHPWGSDDAVINTRAFVVSGAELTAELTHYLLRQNADMLFGAFGLDAEGYIVFEHTIVGSTCDKEELRASVLAVVRTADEYDDQIVARWGGQRALDQALGPRGNGQGQGS